MILFVWHQQTVQIVEAEEAEIKSEYREIKKFLPAHENSSAQVLNDSKFL